MGRITLAEMEKYLSSEKELLTPKEEEQKLKEESEINIFKDASQKKIKITDKNFEKEFDKIKKSLNNSILAINEQSSKDVVYHLNSLIFDTTKFLSSLGVDTTKAWNDFLKNKTNKSNVGKLKDILGEK